MPRFSLQERERCLSYPWPCCASPLVFHNIVGQCSCNHYFWRRTLSLRTFCLWLLSIRLLGRLSPRRHHICLPIPRASAICSRVMFEETAFQLGVVVTTRCRSDFLSLYAGYSLPLTSFRRRVAISFFQISSFNASFWWGPRCCPDKNPELQVVCYCTCTRAERYSIWPVERRKL